VSLPGAATKSRYTKCVLKASHPLPLSRLTTFIQAECSNLFRSADLILTVLRDGSSGLEGTSLQEAADTLAMFISRYFSMTHILTYPKDIGGYKGQNASVDPLEYLTVVLYAPNLAQRCDIQLTGNLGKRDEIFKGVRRAVYDLQVYQERFHVCVMSFLIFDLESLSCTSYIRSRPKLLPWRSCTKIMKAINATMTRWSPCCKIF
jgi:hypothetical protein